MCVCVYVKNVSTNLTNIILQVLIHGFWSRSVNNSHGALRLRSMAVTLYTKFTQSKPYKVLRFYEKINFCFLYTPLLLVCPHTRNTLVVSKIFKLHAVQEYLLTPVSRPSKDTSIYTNFHFY